MILEAIALLKQMAKESGKSIEEVIKEIEEKEPLQEGDDPLQADLDKIDAAVHEVEELAGLAPGIEGKAQKTD
jgi:hypothetical protein